VSPGPATLMSALFPAGGWTDNNIYLSITTDGTVPAGAYITIETEFFVSSSSLATSPPLGKVGVGAPSANAQFIGQTYLDTVAPKLYTAVTVGSGAADWV